MNATPSFTCVDDEKIIDSIQRARRRVVLVAPGVSDRVAAQIVEAWSRLGATAVVVILDVDPEVCRLGYGTIEALQSLREAAVRVGAVVGSQPGVRIAVLVCDDDTYIYSPPPLLVEAGSHHPERPNAIQLEAVPKQIAEDVGIGPNSTRDQKIGLDPVTPQKVALVAKDLKEAPPKRFDLERQVRVFTNRFQFVELEMSGFMVSQKKVSISPTLMGLASDGEVARRFNANFNLLSKGDLVVRTGGVAITEKGLREQRAQIARAFLVALPEYGQVVLKANKPRLEDAVDELRKDVAAFQQGVLEQIEALSATAIQELFEVLFPKVIENPPAEYRKYIANPGKKEVGEMLLRDLTASFEKARSGLREMTVKLLFKDLTYDSLVDEKFLQVAEKAMPHVGPLYTEFMAAKSVDDCR